MNKAFLISWICMLAFISACVPPPDFGAEPEQCQRSSYRGVFVLNEGVWTQNNSTLDFILPESGQAPCSGVFSQVNDQALGDTGNSTYLDADTLYLVINQSRRVYKLQMPSLKLLGTLEFPSGSSPREMVKVAPNRAYLSSLTDNGLYRFDPASMELRGDPIWVENHMEGIVHIGEKLFVACGNYAFPARNNKLAVIDLRGDSVSNYIELPYDNPGRVRIYQDRILVLCRGNYDPNEPGSALIEVDPDKESVLRNLSFEVSTSDFDLAEDACLILGDSGISRLDLTNWNLDPSYLPKKQLTDNQFDLLYTLSYDAEMGELYVSNARFGGVSGELIRLDPFLNILQRWSVGIFPGEVFFYR